MSQCVSAQALSSKSMMHAEQTNGHQPVGPGEASPTRDAVEALPMQPSAPGVLLHKLNYSMKHDFPAFYTTEAGSFKHFTKNLRNNDCA